ncbi:MAG: L-2-amino-thiazoline-4-carboxylic acid hydrolase [Fluviicoccus sp.]|uniref:L-2-amino-thiazoline-4-carboxylic acid hydrolase n=1 Tax=Fluviicoccus sp. TaxID=2003552 RepID=UPI002721C352|nr:L-2-amino-thiazoline-4-carboxylic acid hydrolase [Fluviicoccus sp.]MDO8331137.1 L-2-amino-thiazoline-4-carboxylic acid hydrolase [Fluviicoccus sp.]
MNRQELSARLALLAFDLTTGHPLAMQLLARELGWRSALGVALYCQRELLLRNPFDELNRLSPPNLKQSLSQRQMAPIIVLDRVLGKRGFDREQRYHIVREVTLGVALAVLGKSIPRLDRERFSRSSPLKKARFFERLTRRFYNTVGKLEVRENGFSLTVTRCYFNDYAEGLNVSHLMPILCESDVLFSNSRKSDVVFFRSRTLAQDRQPCNFQITIK